MVWHSTAMDSPATSSHERQHSPHSSHHSRKKARLSRPSSPSSHQHSSATVQSTWMNSHNHNHHRRHHHHHHHHHHHQSLPRHMQTADQSSPINACSTTLTMPTTNSSPSSAAITNGAISAPSLSTSSSSSSSSSSSLTPSSSTQLQSPNSMATATTATTTLVESTPAPVAREIPGFYYDPEKKRYFKITANHVHGSQHPHSAQSVKEKMAVKPTLDPIVRPKQVPAPAKPVSYSTVTRLLSDRSLGHLKSQSHQLSDMHSLLVRQWKRDRHQEPTLISFQTSYSHIAQHPTRNDLFLGTPKGELWQYHFTDQAVSTPGRHARSGSDWCFRRNNVDYSEMTSLHILSDDFLISTYLGNLDRAGMIRVQKDTKDPSDLKTVLTYSPKRSNVWTSAQHGGRIAIGIDKQLGVLSDDWLVDGSSPKLQTYWTGSDVFAVAMEPTFGDSGKPEIVYAGCRNGLVKVFDVRQPAPQQPKFSDRSPQFRHHYRLANGGGGVGLGGRDFMNATRDQEGSILRGMGHEGSSVHCLQRIGAFYLLTMAMNGEIALWDTRYIGPNAVEYFSKGREGGDSGPVLVPRRPSITSIGGVNSGSSGGSSSSVSHGPSTTTMATAKSSPLCKLRTAIPNQLSKVGFSINADQTLVAAPNIDNTVSFWSTRTGQRVHDIQLPSQDQITQLRFSNDTNRPGIWVAVPNQVQWWGFPSPR